MVEVIYDGRFGNRLFQYCFGRILAENLGFKLKADPIPGFPNTAVPVNGRDYSDYPAQTITGQAVDLKAILKDKSKRKIVLNGSFQKYEYYKPYKSLIKNNWLFMDVQPIERATPDDIVVYIRRGDYVIEGRALPFSYYDECLKKAKYDRVFICSDDPGGHFISLFKKYKPTIHHTAGNYLSDFRFIMTFNKIIQSASSFSWWAAFLSNAKEIHYPIHGFWSEDSDINLKVDDESRYIYVKCSQTYKLTLRERMKIWRERCSTVEGTRMQINRVIKKLTGKMPGVA